MTQVIDTLYEKIDQVRLIIMKFLRIENKFYNFLIEKAEHYLMQQKKLKRRIKRQLVKKVKKCKFSEKLNHFVL